jgi:hypothetical protein
VKFPVDGDTLSTWSQLLNLTPEQTTATLNDIETILRIGYDHRPDELLDASFEAIASVDEFALIFLITGLREAGHRDAARSVELRAIEAQLGTPLES